MTADSGSRDVPESDNFESIEEPLAVSAGCRVVVSPYRARAADGRKINPILRTCNLPGVEQFAKDALRCRFHLLAWP